MCIERNEEFVLMMINSTIDKVTIKIQTGKTPPSKEEKYFNGGLNWYTPSDLNKKLLNESKRTITKLAYEEKKATTYPKGTVLLSCIGDIGKLGIITDDTSSSNQQITGLIPDTNKITSEYLYYWCLAHKKVFESKATLGILPMLNNKKLRKIKISYDDNKDNQIKIANFLTKVETLISKREESITLLDELLKSTFLDMFGDPVLNEKRWDTNPLEKLVTDDCSVSYGIVQPGEEFIDGVPIVRPVNLSKSPLKVENLKCIDPKISKIFDRTLLNGDELLLTVRGTVGDIGLATKELKGANVTRGITPLRFSTDIDKTFYYYQLKSKPMQNKIQTYVKGAALRQINLKDLRKLKLITHTEKNKDTVNSFVKKVNRIESMKLSYEDSLDKLNKLFGSLSQRAFKGELDLSGMIVIERQEVETIHGMAKSGAGNGEHTDIIDDKNKETTFLDKVIDKLSTEYKKAKELNKIIKKEKEKEENVPQNYVDNSNNPIYNEEFLWMLLKQSNDDINFESINRKLEKFSFREYPSYDRVKSDIYSLIKKGRLEQKYISDLKNKETHMVLFK